LLDLKQIADKAKQTMSNTPHENEPLMARKRPAFIDLLDDDDDNADKVLENEKSVPTNDFVPEASTKAIEERKRRKSSSESLLEHSSLPPHSAALDSFQARPAHMPPWMHNASTRIRPGASLPNFNSSMPPRPRSNYQTPFSASRPPPYQHKLNIPFYSDLPPGFNPSWEQLLPPTKLVAPAKQRKYFKLSLLNVNEFTITGLPVTIDGPPSSITGLRAPIKAISHGHGRAVYERETGKWKIPLGAYQAFAAYLQQDPLTTVDGISQHLLQVASIERARQAQGYPSPEQLIEKGMPPGLANALAPFQRGGVDFVLRKGGRALIADGKPFMLLLQGFRPLVSTFIVLIRHGIGKNHSGSGLYGTISQRMAIVSANAQQCSISLGE